MAVGRMLLQLAREEMEIQAERAEQAAALALQGAGAGVSAGTGAVVCPLVTVTYSQDGSTGGKPGKVPAARVEELVRSSGAYGAGLDDISETPRQGLLCIEFKREPRYRQ